MQRQNSYGFFYETMVLSTNKIQLHVAEVEEEEES